MALRRDRKAGVNPQFWANPLVFSVFGKTTIDCTIFYITYVHVQYLYMYTVYTYCIFSKMNCIFCWYTPRIIWCEWLIKRQWPRWYSLAAASSGADIVTWDRKRMTPRKWRTRVKTWTSCLGMWKTQGSVPPKFVFLVTRSISFLFCFRDKFNNYETFRDEMVPQRSRLLAFFRC